MLATQIYVFCIQNGAYTLVNMNTNTNSNETLTRQMRKSKRNNNGNSNSNSNTIEEEKKNGKKKTIAENEMRTNAQIPLRFIIAYYVAQNSVHFVCSRFFLSFFCDASELISPAPS